MPYIKAEHRPEIDEEVKPLAEMLGADVGKLNYAITTLLIETIKIQGGPNYGRINALMGTLSCVKAEFYRRMAAPYEDKKIEENGDVFS